MNRFTRTRLGTFVAAGLAVGLLAACSSDGDTATTETVASEVTADPSVTTAEVGAGVDDKCVVAMSFGGLDITVWVYMLEVMEPIMKEEGCEFLTHDPAWDLQKQITDWQAWGNRGDLDAIMSWPVQKDAVIPVTAELKDKGAQLIGYAMEWDGVTCSQTFGGYESGVKLVEESLPWMKEKYGDEPFKAAVLAYRESDLNRERTDAIIETMAKEMPNAEVFEVTGLSREEGYNGAKAQLTAHPDTQVWFSVSNDQMHGAYQAILDNGVAVDDPDWQLNVIDAVDETLDMLSIPDSIVRTGVTLDMAQIGRNNAKLLIDVARTGTCESIVLDTERVTPENIKQFYTPERQAEM
jgi:ABC-type sugar transport system substrate-binding protein